MNSQETIDLADVTIRSMTVNDIRQVLEIQDEGGLSRWTHLDYAKEIKNRDSIKKVAIIKDKKDEKVIGFAVLRLLSEADESNRVYESAEIYNIALGKSFQSRGIGQQILDTIICELKKHQVSEVWLEVRESNTKAINFYKKSGFCKQTVRKQYYTDPLEDAYILKLSLNYENQI